MTSCILAQRIDCAARAPATYDVMRKVASSGFFAPNFVPHDVMRHAPEKGYPPLVLPRQRPIFERSHTENGCARYHLIGTRP